MIPAEHPRYVIYVKIEDPQGAYYGGIVAAPVFVKIAREAMLHAGVLPMTIAQLVARLPASTRVIGDATREIASIEIDSRRVTPGAMFVALAGEHTDGHAFIQARGPQRRDRGRLGRSARARRARAASRRLPCRIRAARFRCSRQPFTAIRRARSTCSASPAPTAKPRPRA